MYYLYHEPEIVNILGVPSTSATTVEKWPKLIREVKWPKFIRAVR